VFQQTNRAPQQNQPADNMHELPKQVGHMFKQPGCRSKDPAGSGNPSHEP
jgi:hypothetical protein